MRIAIAVAGATLCQQHTVCTVFDGGKGGFMDLGSVLISTGLSLAEKIVFSWFQEGRSRVKQDRIDRDVAELARQEAIRYRLREDDLQRVTERLLQELVAGSPQLAYVKQRLKDPVIQLDVDLKNPASSSELLQDLKARLGLIAQQEIASARSADNDVPSTTGQVTSPVNYEIVEPNHRHNPTSDAIGAPVAGIARPDFSHQARSDVGHTRASELLDELNRRVDEREHPRT
jgi:hypothetical protein